MAESKSPVYIGIPEHVEIRRDLLTSSKELIASLRAYERVKEIKAERAAATFELHKVMDELGVLVKKTKMCMPKPPTKLNVASKDVDEEKGTKKSKNLSMDKLGALDSELSKIEAKLKKLD